MDFLNHFVAASLMKDAARFARIEQLAQLGPGLALAQPRPRAVSSHDGRRMTSRPSQPSCVPSDGPCEARTLAR